MLEWLQHALWWHVYPLGFVAAPPRTPESPSAAIHHRLRHLLDWLDYARDLGVSGLLLGPIFASTSHGYDTIDPFRIDPRLGDDDDFAALASAARQRGLRLILDGVFNHVGRDFPAFAQVLVQGAAAPQADWFHLQWPDGATQPDYQCFEGHSQLVTLNHANPAVADHVVRVMTHWLDRGASGWRLDAAYAVAPPFWRAVLDRVRASHPHMVAIGEVIHGDYGAWIAETGADSLTQYELWKAIWSSLNDRNLFELAWALKRHDQFLASFPPLTFVGNHDVTRLASQLTDSRHLPHALVILFTLGGIPCIYAGDEQGFTGIKEQRAGGDDAIRPPFPAHPADLPAEGWPIYRLHQRLIGLRRRHAWLHRATTTTAYLTNRQLCYVSAAGDQRIAVCLNLDDDGHSFVLDGALRLMEGDATLSHDGQHGQIHLPAHGWAILDA